MKLESAQIGKTYLIEDLSICEPCVFDSRKCPVIALTERGFLKDVPIVVVKHQFGLYILKVETGEFAVREEDVSELIIKEI